MESTFTTSDGIKLYTKTWKPQVASSIHLIFVHGFSDHVDAYYVLFPTLASPPHNITVHGFDQRGWGRSAPKKSDWGVTSGTHQVLSDIAEYISQISSSITTGEQSSKLFLMGHSMGGAESLMYMLSDPKSFSVGPSKPLLPISGLLLESPHIGFPPESKPNSLVVLAGRLAAKVAPRLQMVQELDASFMSRDPQVCKDWEEDPLCHDTGTLEGLAGLLDRANYLNAFGETGNARPDMRHTLPCPVWWAHGTADKVCDFDSSRKLYDRLIANDQTSDAAKQSRFVAYEGAYHKLHGEPDGVGEKFARDAADWMLQIADIDSFQSTGSTSTRGESFAATAGTASTSAGGAEDVKSKL
ncbi:hypothetical protein LTS08_008233 [Lithohypha guttulata]|nr:hypothetical protein LTS08_008233 [Lithohypha guttulata]